MRSVVTLLFLVLTVLVDLTTMRTCGANQDELILKFIKSSGFASQIEQVHSAFWAAVPADAFVSYNQRNEAWKRFKKDLPADRLMSILRDQVLDSFDQDRIDSLIKFYETGLGRKLIRVQRDMLSVNNLKSIRESRKTVALLDTKRLELLSRIMELNKAARTNTQLTSTLVEAMLMGDTDKPGEDGPSESRVNKSRNPIALEQNLVDETMILSYANNLKHFDEKELNDLIAFLESPEAEWLGKVSSSFLNKAVWELGKALSHTLANQSGQGR